MTRMETVLDAALRRIRFVFDRFGRIVVSVSGGKDSQVLLHLIADVARELDREVDVFFLDQEAEYAGSIEVIERMMTMHGCRPWWYQVPIRMTNATSHKDIFLHAWGPDEEWMRAPSPIAIREAPGAPDRFYDFFPWFERQFTEDTAFFVGLRSMESLTRWRAVKNNAGYLDIGWSTKTKQTGRYRFYPIFDWKSSDVWKYLADNEIKYNTIYDKMFMMGVPEREMRVSFLLHEHSYKALTGLQRLEPETYDRLLRRIGGVHYAARYADEALLSARELPADHASWRAFRDYLLDTTGHAHTERFRKRFAGQGDDEATCREHVRQLLIGDFENSVPVRRRRAADLRKYWWDRV
jgi:predicted phosphoadenosine phosphosulfate sulfurtransferase